MEYSPNCRAVELISHILCNINCSGYIIKKHIQILKHKTNNIIIDKKKFALNRINYILKRYNVQDILIIEKSLIGNRGV